MWEFTLVRGPLSALYATTVTAHNPHSPYMWEATHANFINALTVRWPVPHFHCSMTIPCCTILKKEQDITRIMIIAKRNQWLLLQVKSCWNAGFAKKSIMIRKPLIVTSVFIKTEAKLLNCVWTSSRAPLEKSKPSYRYMEIYRNSSMLLLVIKGRFKHAALAFVAIIIMILLGFRVKKDPAFNLLALPLILVFFLFINWIFLWQLSVQSRRHFCIIDAEYSILSQNKMIMES